MLKLIKSLFTGSPSNVNPTPEATVEYSGFRITPCPQSAKGGWSTEAIIEKEIDGETKQHHFIRADSSSGKEGAIELILSKSRTTIDQLGEKIFR
ncbi:MAG: hypothetical protein GKR96_01025 [Gammaproteobacteria bacterium]|nr:hypothetical protein [Gammaproteobacteria bacterium]